jgi:hypothetical protein
LVFLQQGQQVADGVKDLTGDIEHEQNRSQQGP